MMSPPSRDLTTRVFDCNGSWARFEARHEGGSTPSPGTSLAGGWGGGGVESAGRGEESAVVCGDDCCARAPVRHSGATRPAGAGLSCDCVARLGRVGQSALIMAEYPALEHDDKLVQRGGSGTLLRGARVTASSWASVCPSSRPSSVFTSRPSSQHPSWESVAPQRPSSIA
jgi:hypothetical protein